MTIIPNERSVVEVYQWLVQIVTPRPIAWVSTIDAKGIVNVAPFSFFNVVGANPPLVIFSPTRKRDGNKKDTLVNIEQLGEFVVNTSTVENVHALNLTAKELPHEESELTFAQLESCPSQMIRPPRLACAPVQLECQLDRLISYGDGPISPTLIIGKIVCIHIDEKILNTEGKVDPHKYVTLGRLGGDFYSRTTDLFELKRPS